MDGSWYHFSGECLLLTLHIQPNSSRTMVAGRHGDALKIKIAAPAVDNKANQALLKFLAMAFKVPANRIAVKHGEQGRRKVVEICRPQCDPETLLTES